LTVRVKAVLWERAPDVAVTVTVEVTGVGGGVDVCPPPPPQQVIENMLSVPATANRMGQRDLFCLKLIKPITSATEVIGTKGNLDGNWLLLAPPEYPSVRVEVPLVLMKVGLNVHDPPAGSPEHERETLPMKPLAGVTVTVLVAVSPAPKVNVLGESVMVKSGGSTLME